MPGVPVCLVGEVPLGCGEIFRYAADADVGARIAKTRIYDLAPAEWEYVVYLDADTELIAPVPFLFEALAAGWEFLICHNPARYINVGLMRRPDNGTEVDALVAQLGSGEFIQYNGGVFGFRRCAATAELLHRWHTEWLVYGQRDQAALDRALEAVPVRVYPLGTAWNTVTRYCAPETSAGILHYPLEARRWRGKLPGRLDGDAARAVAEAWAAQHPRYTEEPCN